MDYKSIYDSLIHRARNRIPSGYVERHHITPKCMGGSDENHNLVALTPEEHFLAHILLVKIFPNEPNLIIAVNKMARGHKGKRARKLYGWLKKKFAKRISELQAGSGNSQYGTMWISNAILKENRKIKKNDNIPAGWIAGRNVWVKMGKVPKPRPPFSEESKKKMSASRKRWMMNNPDRWADAQRKRVNKRYTTVPSSAMKEE